MWNDLTMSERADVIKMAVKAGLRDMKSIRDFYDNSLKYADGGPKVTSKNRGNLFSGKDTPTQQMTTKSKQAPWYSELDEAVMGELMQEFRNIAHPGNIEHASYKTDVRGKKGGTAQRTYLLPRFEQEDIFLRDGYIKGKEGDYGLVKKAVNNRNLPVWQTKPDVVSRETLVPIGNAYGMDSYGYINRDKDLVHAESHPAAFYVDGSTGKLYTKGWDLNDYGGIGGGNSSKYNILEKVGANILDFIGSPVVVTTGFQEVTNPWGGPSEHLNRGATIQDLFDYDDDGYPIKSNLGELLDTTMNKQGLHRENIDGKWVYSLPEVTVYGNKKAEGGSIHIAPSKRGTFTAAATKHGMGVQEFASKVLANKDNYSPAMVKKANFAKNASKWKHSLGGYLFI